MPGSIDPISSAEPERLGGVDRDRARAPRPASCRSSTQATVIASGRLAVGEVPGLKSVPIATGTPRSMNVRAGAWWSFIRNQVVAGSSVATTGAPSARPARGQRLDPGVGRRREMVGGGRPELRGELGAARRGELVGVEPDAHPVPGGRLRIRRDWSALKTPSSQNTSQKRARPCAATPGSCSSMTDRT